MELSNDLSHAKVFYSCLGNAEARTRSQETLDHSGRFIYGLLKKRLRLKMIPVLDFRYDPSIEGAITLTEKLESLKQPPAA